MDKILVAWVDAWCKANPGKNTDLQYLVAERWPATVEMFGGQQSWLEFWNEVKKCDCRFIVADVVDLKMTPLVAPWHM